jgi:hypothetical protein
MAAADLRSTLDPDSGEWVYDSSEPEWADVPEVRLWVTATKRLERIR